LGEQKEGGKTRGNYPFREKDHRNELVTKRSTIGTGGITRFWGGRYEEAKWKFKVIRKEKNECSEVDREGKISLSRAKLNWIREKTKRVEEFPRKEEKKQGPEPKEKQTVKGKR